ncbi:hypothetical protein [Caballeronia novacaledonica]|uniref:Uncharacterized protein n=2 Tax=Caballeronia TaxID=1827195 RepID=A0AA37IJN2_9BURK|nr:hypothetical protein [Caballeronia novacaledonica]GJH31011.1 hypothetical protein CBA19CS42_40865 [Caballeronia novacaledonica]
MSELILEASLDAKDLFDAFAAEHRDQAEVETSSGQDGGTLLNLVIENAPLLSASISLLIGALRGRGIKVKASKNGVEIDIGAAAKPE